MSIDSDNDDNEDEDEDEDDDDNDDDDVMAAEPDDKDADPDFEDPSKEKLRGESFCAEFVNGTWLEDIMPAFDRFNIDDRATTFILGHILRVGKIDLSKVHFIYSFVQYSKTSLLQIWRDQSFSYAFAKICYSHYIELYDNLSGDQRSNPLEWDLVTLESARAKFYCI